MPLSRQVFFLFTLNFLDAVFTLYWVRNGFASEGNHLMATLLDMGDLPFLGVKIAVGATAALVLWYWRDKTVAKYGLGLVLFLYVGLMGIHFFTGLSAFGLISDAMLKDFADFSDAIFAFVI